MRTAIIGVAALACSLATPAAASEMPKPLVGQWCSSENDPSSFQPDDGTYSDCNDLIIRRSGFMTHDGDDCTLRNYRANPNPIAIVYKMTFSCREPGKRPSTVAMKFIMDSRDGGLLKITRIGK